MKCTARFVVTVFINLCSREQLVLERTTRPREGACRPIHMMNLQRQAVINNSQIVGRTPSKFYLQITGIILHDGALLCAVRSLSYYWEEERKWLGKTI